MLANESLKSVFPILKRFLKPYRVTVIMTVALNVAVGFLMSTRPLVIAPALDVFAKTKTLPAQSLGETSLNNLGPTLISFFGLDANNILNIGILVAVLLFLFTVGIAIFGFIVKVLLVRTNLSLLRDVTVILHKRLLTFPLIFFNKERAGDLVSRISNDVRMMTYTLNTVAMGVLRSSVQILITATILVYTDPLLSLFLALSGLFHMLITRVTRSNIKKRSKKAFDSMGDMGARLLETFTGIRLIKTFAAEKYDNRRILEAANILRKNSLLHKIAWNIDSPVRMIADALIVGFVLVMSFYAIEQGRLSIQSAALFFYLAQQLLTPVSELFKLYLKLFDMLGGASRVIELLETKTSFKDGKKIADEFNAAIKLSNVSFHFEKNLPVLKNITLTINRGEMLAIVGPSGAGKTTLVDCILRLYDVQEGSITYDGEDIREFKQKSYRGKFGVVAQECLLFNATIRENIIYNRPADEEDLSHAIWIANADEFIKDFPARLDTVVGDRGVRLSGGQRQRIAIARAIYGQSSILALDEATSSLDSESERAVQEAINRVSKEITIIVIAHRLSTIGKADKIAVLNDGQIEAIGAHDEIMETSPTYRRLYNLQFTKDINPQSKTPMGLV